MDAQQPIEDDAAETEPNLIVPDGGTATSGEDGQSVRRIVETDGNRPGDRLALRRRGAQKSPARRR